MSDGRKNNKGTLGNKGGRPKKADEIKKIEMMDSVCPPLKAWQALFGKVEAGDTKAIQFWIEHRYGKAPAKVDLTTDDKPINSIPPINWVNGAGE